MLESFPLDSDWHFTIFATLFMVLGMIARLKSHNIFMMGLLMNQISEFSLFSALCVFGWCTGSYGFV